MTRRALFAVLLAIPFFLCLATAPGLFANRGGSGYGTSKSEAASLSLNRQATEGAEPAAGPSATLDFLGKVVNFLVLFGGLAYVLRKPVAALLGQRVRDVEESLRRAEAAKVEAREKLAEVEAKIAGLEEEVRRMIEHAETVAARERERIMQLAADESQRIRKYAEQEIDEMTRAGVLELRAYAAEKATSLARERILSRLTPGDQAALIDKSIERLSRLYEESRPR